MKISDPKDGPCGNKDCDGCYPIPRWEVSRDTVRRIRHTREIKVTTREEALAIYAKGTAWPESYDERTLTVIEEGEPVIQPVEARPAKWDCYHTLNDPTRYDTE